MTTTELIDPVVQQLRDSLERIARTDIDTQLVRAEDLGAANFRAYRPLFEKIMSFVRRLDSLNWELVPPELVEQVRQRSENLANALVEAGQLSLNTENPTQQRDQIAQKITSHFNALQQNAIPLVGFLAWETIDLTATREALTNLLCSMRPTRK